MFAVDRLEVIALFDWGLSTLGHPLADLAYQCMQWRFPRDWPVKGLAGLDLADLGIPAEADYVAAYVQRTGAEIGPHWPFYLAFSFFRLAAICQGVKKPALDGNASSAEAMTVGGMVAPLAALGRDAAG